MTMAPIIPDVRLIPLEIATLYQWVVFRIEDRGGDKPTKVPYRADGEGKASSTDPETWAPVREALRAVEEGGGRYSGIGFVFAPDDGMWGLDLDNCCTEPFHKAAPEAHALAVALGSYAEWSPSGRGLHVICRAEHPAGARHRAALTDAVDGRPAVHAEAYDRGRYFTFTGAHYSGPLEITDAQFAVDALCRVSGDGTRGLFAPKQRKQRRLSTTPRGVAVEMADESDAGLLARMFKAKNGAAVRRLFHGDVSGYGSASEADLALCSHLLYWTRGDMGRADRLFRQSALMRDKWDERRGELTYGERTLDAL